MVGEGHFAKTDQKPLEKRIKIDLQKERF